MLHCSGWKKHLSIILSFLVFTFFVPDLKAQSPEMTFMISYLQAQTKANWMFEKDDPGVSWRNDSNPFTYENWSEGIYAYYEFIWSNTNIAPYRLTTSEMTSENTSVLESTANVTIKLDQSRLHSFKHVNVVNANGSWNTAGQAGDYRIYAGGIIEVRVSGVLKLRLTDCRTSGFTKYPTAAECIFPYGWGGWQNNIGPGAAVDGTGQGVIDDANSDDAWEAELDPNNTGHVAFTVNSQSQVVQGDPGYFNYGITLRPAIYSETVYRGTVPSGDAVSVSNAAGVTFNFTQATSGEQNNNTREIVSVKRSADPGGALPGGIERIAPVYWHLGTLLQSFSTSITFDISSLSGVSNQSNLRILYRKAPGADWEVLATNTATSGALTVSTITELGEYAVGSTGGNALPVELTFFNAKPEGKKVKLNWTTATEINNYGFEIERQKAGMAQWEKIAFTAGHGNSNSPRYYEYTDTGIKSSGKYLYRLKQVDTDGGSEYSPTAEAEVITAVGFNLSQNYPNPFNPVTTISYELPEGSNVILQVFDVMGQKVSTLADGYAEAGRHDVSFDASRFPSGIYYYWLQAGDYSSSRRMCLIK